MVESSVSFDILDCDFLTLVEMNKKYRKITVIEERKTNQLNGGQVASVTTVDGSGFQIQSSQF